MIRAEGRRNNKAVAQIYAVLNAGSANVTFDSTSSLADGEFLAAELGQLYAAGILRNTVVAGPPGPSPFAPDPTNLLTVTGSPAETLFLSPSISAVVVSAPM